MSATNRRRGVCVRRSPHLIAYWRGRTLVACNYATGMNVEVPPRASELLSACDDWTPLAKLAEAEFVSRETFAATIDRMVTLTLLERSDRPRDPRSEAMDTLRPWNPQVGFFHSTTRDLPFVSSRVAARHAKTNTKPPPPVTKRYVGAPVVSLPRPDGDDPFAQVLRARRTWRRYSSEPVTLDELATVLALSAGVQQWVHAGAQRIPLKTSPSGGGRHAVECYVVARDVRGLRAGVYHTRRIVMH